MSTVIEHLADLRKIANRYGNEMHGLRQNDPDFQFQAILFCGVHLDELEALTSGNVTGRQRDALRMALDIGQRRLLLPIEVARIEAILAEPPADPLKPLTELSEELGLESVTGVTAAPLEVVSGCDCEACKPQGTLMKPENTRMIVCAICGNKRCPHATDHRHACTNSNEPGQPGSSWENIKPFRAPESPQPLAPPPGYAQLPLPITEEMHVAAVKVLHRAHGVDGLPQRMLDAMVAAAPQPPASALPLAVGVGPAGVTLARAADFLEWYVAFIKESVMSVDIERHPYLPELEEVAQEVRALSVSAAAPPPPGRVVPLTEEKMRPLTVKVCHMEGHDPFVFWLNGMATSGVIKDLDADLLANQDDILQSGFGDYEFQVTRYEGQYGFEGRCEIAPGWEFEQVGFTPLQTEPEGGIKEGS